MPRHVALLRVDPSILRGLLGLPPTVEIRGGSYDFQRQRFVFLIEGDPALPVVPEGDQIPLVDIVIRNGVFQGFRFD